ncbi:MAG: rhomboid family intramembrane serine protease [Planctomycetaceae bacterium]|jgi:membrane associated rhomboid family serine protease|nr:rhomboid family intramembrane serine protease [Planctomycetaceae bacterium]
MGLDDRDYLRDEARRYGDGGGGFNMRASFSDQWAIKTIVIINVIVWVLQLATTKPGAGGGITPWLSLSLSDLGSFQIWRLLTYGFCHSVQGDDAIWHIVFNMLFLWMFGRMVEGIYGSREFLAFYLAGIIFSGVAQIVFMGLMGYPASGTIGASGGVNAVVILTAMHFPNVKVFLFFIIPIPLWVLAAFKVGMDSLGLVNFIMGRGLDDHVAHAAHLGGAAFGYLYFVRGWRVSPLFQKFQNLSNPVSKMQRKMRDQKRKKELQVFEPNDDDLREEVDRILAKIKAEGEASLSDEERETLERASRVFRGR